MVPLARVQRRAVDGGGAVSDGPAIHLAQHLHDVTNAVTGVWCDKAFTRETVVHDPMQATCLLCLEAAALFGNECRRRFRNLLNRRVP
jgi:hypothetical protein